MTILTDLLNEESISGARSGRASLQIRREVLLRKDESISKVRFQYFFRPQTDYWRASEASETLSGLFN